MSIQLLDGMEELSSFLDQPAPSSVLIPTVELTEGTPDPRLLRLSYSGLQDFHACPRYFQLRKLNAPTEETPVETTVTFAYGHAMGEGIQQYLVARASGNPNPLEFALWKSFLGWDVDLLLENEKQKKSYFRAVASLIQFHELTKQGFITDEWEVALFDGKPAAELSFRIDLGSGVTFRGFVDLVLKNKFTGEVMILELKTSSANYVNHYNYKNSAQAIGYSVVLDRIVPGITSYSVQYLVYMTKLERFETFDFPKTFTQRVQWIQDLLWDKKNLLDGIGFYGNYGNWQTRGESCVRFNRVCEFMDVCQLGTDRLMTPLNEKMLEETNEYMFEFTLEELLQ